MMGCDSSVDDECDSREQPYHEVLLHAYYIDLAEATVAQYRECVLDGVCTAPKRAASDPYCNWLSVDIDNQPINCISWAQAKSYCEWSGKRLLTEAEWEKAARGTDSRIFPWGDTEPTCELAVMIEGDVFGCGADGSMPVCSKSPAGNSPYGLCDMAGNVNEFVSDWYGAWYYSTSPNVDPAGPDTGTSRVVRGGGFYDQGYGLKTTTRGSYSASADGAINLGVRCGMDRFCVPNCQGRTCGNDGCGGSCGYCADGSNCNSNGLCEKDGMVLIPAGSFWMGCNSTVDSDCYNDEKPYHKVTLSAYYIDKTEVTQGEYRKCVDAGECDTPSCKWDPTGTPNRPVVCVDWNDATAYCAWAGKRLPTEAEWEKAARGTDGRKYPWGNQTATCEYAVMYDGSHSGCGTGSTWDVCSKSPAGDSPYGLCDMSGNVWEWVSDWFGSGYYSNSPSSNPTGPDSGSSRVSRGGSFDFYGVSLRASSRDYDTPSHGHADLGFRCSRSQ